MKKRYIKAIVIALVLALVLVLSACDFGLGGDDRAPDRESESEVQSEVISQSYSESASKDYEIKPENSKQPSAETESEIQRESESELVSESQSAGEEKESEKEPTHTTIIEQTTINQTINQDVTNNDITIEGTESNIVYATAKGLRSVVSVYCTFTTTVTSGNPWNPTQSEQTYSSAGAGVIYKLDSTGDAFVITNYHVVYDADANTENKISNDINLFLYGMEYIDYKIPATYVGGSMQYDLAVLRVEDSEILKDAIARGTVGQAVFADSDKISVGQDAIAIGNPEANGISVTSGIVSVDSEHIDMTGADGVTAVSFRVIRVDTAINSGNSGGGLFNGKGEIIGIVNAKIMSTNVENIGYAIPSNVARAIADNVIDYCFEKECESVMRVILGIGVKITDQYTVYDVQTGLITKHDISAVDTITLGSLADGKFQQGDVIKSITLGERTVEITRQHHVIDTLLDARIGDIVTFVVEREGEETSFTIEIIEGALVAYK